jgi:hypothetical protein
MEMRVPLPGAESHDCPIDPYGAFPGQHLNENASFRRESGHTKRDVLMKPISSLFIIVATGFLVACAATLPPPELLDARQACSHAFASPATNLVPAELLKVREALARAEHSFRINPKSLRTKELAGIAVRTARQTEALAAAARDSVCIARTNPPVQAAQISIVRAQ